MDEHEQAHARRELLRLGVAATVVAVWQPAGMLWGWTQELLPATPNTTPGPFYPVVKPLERDADLTHLQGRRNRAQGQVIHVSGRVLDQRGEPIRGARVELWQANTFGRYSHRSDPNPAPLDPDFQGYGVQLTDREARFRFTTIKPGAYPFDATRTRAPHIHFEVTGRVDRRTTQIFFADEPLNSQDFVLQAVPRDRERLVTDLLPAPHGEDPASRLVQWDIVLPRG